VEFEALQTALLRAAEARELGAIFRELVDGLVALGEVALARIWLVGPGDQCATCPMRAECPTNVPCLHLEASAGVSKSGGRWESIDGQFRRFPLGVRKIGRIGKSGESLTVDDVRAGSTWIVRPDWAEREQIEAMAGHPLVFRGEVLGALAVFTRRGLRDHELRWLRLFADHAAIVIANSRAFAEVERLRRELEIENLSLRDELGAPKPTSDLVGESAGLTMALRQVELVAKTDAIVLILGESGVGKELFARAVHTQSGRRGAPFIKVNCAAIPRDLFESEFFGHVRGAFTGALRDRLGRFELADKGTLFLDEIGEVPLELQSKLLRVLQESTFERVGEERTRKVDVRIVAATHRDLREEALAGRFRQDLYFRLGAFPITVPPLRDRKEDLPALAAYFVRTTAQRLGMQAPALRPEALRALTAYDFPGNVRELGHVIERALILGEGRRLDIASVLPRETSGVSGRDDAPAAPEQGDLVMTDAELRALEKKNLERALTRSGGKLYGEQGAAALLGIPVTTLSSRLRAAGIGKKR
jgi:transcriptional regulator with GAF, ATPase, and Fis domain